MAGVWKKTLNYLGLVEDDEEFVDDLGLAECSMGMTADLEVAVEEGSTMVRVGTALFGPRAPLT